MENEVKYPYRQRIIFGQIGAIIILIILIIIHLINHITVKSLVKINTEDQKPETLTLITEMDDLLKKGEKFINKNELKLLYNDDLQWLNELILFHDSTDCYRQDDLVLFYHYCENESRYPLIYDRNCLPHWIDNYEKLINETKQKSNETNETDQEIISNFVIEFVNKFNRLLKNSEGLNELMKHELSRAFRYAKQIGRDCEHPAVWSENFDPNHPSTTDQHELWTLYCKHQTQFPALVSNISGKYYVPGYYYERIKKPETLKTNEIWMIKWMEKFIQYYNSNPILKQRFETELNQSKTYAQKNNLQCL